MPVELIEQLEHHLQTPVAALKLGLEAIALICVLIGLVQTGLLAIALTRHHRSLAQTQYQSQKYALVLLRLRFGVWLAVALEFQLGADIVSTTITPTLESLGRLGAITAIRTFLNYFLNRELAEEFELQRRKRQTVLAAKKRYDSSQ